MNLAKKIFNERRRLSLSQEQLAEQMEVSRQAVSKWESGQSMPDLDNLLIMSQIFGVSTDYLLKEDAEISPADPLTENFQPAVSQTAPPAEDSQPAVSQTENTSSADRTDTTPVLEADLIQKYQTLCFDNAKKIALGVFLCIIGAACYQGITMFFEHKLGVLEDDSPAAIILLLFIVTAVALFVSSGMKMEPYVYLKNKPFTLPENEKKRLSLEYDQYRKKFTEKITIGVVLCVSSVIVYLACEFAAKAQLAYMACDHLSVMLLLVLVACGVYQFISAGIRKECYDVLLQQNGYDNHNKTERESRQKNQLISAIAGVYWCLVTAGFLAYSFITHDWGNSWIVWPVAGCLFGAISSLVTLYTGKKSNHS